MITQPVRQRAHPPRMSPNTKTDGPVGDFVFGDAIIPSGVPGGQAGRAVSICTLVDYSISYSISVKIAFSSFEDNSITKLITHKIITMAMVV